MKQHIKKEQLGELSSQQKNKLVEWCIDKDYSPVSQEFGYLLPLLTIGQMIEFLDGKFINVWRGARKDWLIVIDDDKSIVRKELCDALWEAVKQILDKHKDM